TKAEWTVEFQATRTFTVRRKAVLRIELLDAREEPIAGERVEVERPDGSREEAETDELGRAAFAPGPGRYRLTFPGRAQAEVTRSGSAPEGVEDAREGDQASFECTPGKRRRFQVGARLELVLHDARGEPLAGARYVLEVGGQRREGETGSEGAQAGLVDEELPAGASEAVLTVWPEGGEGPGLRQKLALGALAAPEATEGVQGRLNALGYVSGKVDGDAGPVTQDALKRFQAAHGLSESGQLDDATRAKLVDVFGS
ncbi:MAG TPA: hypothetical protein DEA08_04565, partial [Planctomycetes bacterium]|nr:hypothetical protein [Planctomycetota bacterium]